MSPGEPAQFPVGHPHYEILDTCGKGGMGVVYRARDKRLNRIVALKFISNGDDGTESAESLGRFRREAESIGKLNHPNIATIFELGDWAGTPFLAMELLSGDPLKKRLAPGTGLPLSEVIDYTRQLGAALACAHSEGILHRDIKPSNAMFNSRGTLKLLDFGLAKGIHDSDLTQTGMTVGTLSYMPPEIIAGRDATVQSDLFSFAAVVYEMAAGRTIHAMSLRGHGGSFAAGITPLRSVRPEIPLEFSDAVAKALSSNPVDRYVSVTDFLSALDGTMAEIDDRTRTITGPVPVPTPQPKGLRSWISGIVLAALLLACAAGWLWKTMASKTVRMQTVVVLPFENLSTDPSNQALCDGLQETVSGMLARAPELRHQMLVVPASELRRGQIKTITDAQRQFNAELAITGSVVRTGGGIQVTLNLSDTAPIRQRNSRLVSVTESGAAQLQEKLGTELGTLLGQPQLGSAPLAFGETTSNSQAYNYYLRGKGTLEVRDYEGAAMLFAKALDADPGFSLARAKLAESYVKRNLRDKDPQWLALADAELARAAQAGLTPAVLFSQALIRKATGKSDEAITLFRRFLDAEPGNVDALRLLADEYVAAGRSKEAEETYVGAIRMRPGYWPLYESLGNFYSGQQRYDKALATLRTGTALAPNVSTLHYNLGVVYFRLSRWPEAEAAFQESLTIKPLAVAHANLATLLFYQGKYAESAMHAEEAALMQPSNAINWGNLGDALWQVPGARLKAKSAFSKAAELAASQLSINPRDVSMRKNYALYLAKLGRIPEAVLEVSKVRQAAPANASARFYAARTLAVAGDSSGAFAEIAAALKLGYDLKEVQSEPDFEVLRNSERFQKLRGIGKRD